MISAVPSVKQPYPGNKKSRRRMPAVPAIALIIFADLISGNDDGLARKRARQLRRAISSFWC